MTLSDKKVVNYQSPHEYVYYKEEDVKEFINRETGLIMKHFPMGKEMIVLMSDRAELAGPLLIMKGGKNEENKSRHKD